MKALGTILAVALAAAEPAAAQGSASAPLVAGAGDPLPSLEFRPLGTRRDAPRWRTADLLGERPLLLIYWLSGSLRAGEMLEQARGLMQDLQAAGVEVVVVTSLKPPATESDVSRSARELRLDAPIVLDDDLQLSTTLGIDSVPALTFVDASGTIRMARAQHLRQELAPGVSVEDWLRAGAAKGAWATVEHLEAYNPSTELIGRPYEDFTLPELVTLQPKSLSSLLAPGGYSLLVFWSVNCAPCGRWLPDLAAWYEGDGKDRVRIVSVAAAAGEPIRARTAGFMLDHGIRFPVLMDFSLALKPVYRVASLPAVILIGPDGIIEAASAGATVDVPSLIEGRVARPASRRRGFGAGREGPPDKVPAAGASSLAVERDPGGRAHPRRNGHAPRGRDREVMAAGNARQA